MSSKRFVSSSVSGSSNANSSSTATVKSVPPSNASRASARSCCQETFCSSPTEGAYSPDGREQALGDARPRPARDHRLPRGAAQRLAVLGGQPEQLVQLRGELARVAGRER